MKIVIGVLVAVVALGAVSSKIYGADYRRGYVHKLSPEEIQEVIKENPFNCEEKLNGVDVFYVDVYSKQKENLLKSAEGFGFTEVHYVNIGVCKAYFTYDAFRFGLKNGVLLEEVMLLNHFN